MSGIVGEIQIGDLKPASELQPPKFVPSTADLKPPLDDNAIRAMFQEADKQGIEDLNTRVVAPAPPGQPAPAVVPPKFLRPDGTADEEKLKASTRQLDEAIQVKQKSIDEIVAEYKAKERQLSQLGEQRSQLQRQPLPQAPPPQPAPIQQQPDFQALQQQVLSDWNRDPVGTVIQLSQAIAQTQMAPLRESLRNWEEDKRDNQIRTNVAEIAQNDPRILHPQYYAMMQDVLAEDPGMFRLRNPHKAAWNEVKERLRLGEPSQVQAQPSNPSPTLGGGVPPFVQSLQQPLTPQALRQDAATINPYSEDGRRYEERLREATRDMWQS